MESTNAMNRRDVLKAALGSILGCSLFSFLAAKWKPNVPVGKGITVDVDAFPSGFRLLPGETITFTSSSATSTKYLYANAYVVPNTGMVCLRVQNELPAPLISHQKAVQMMAEFKDIEDINNAL